jgi:17 kDa outer membrane surface antigen
LCSLLRLTAVIGLIAVGGCSYQLSSFTPKDGADMEQTGALGRPQQQAEAVPPPEVDLVYARAVAADALARSGKDDSVPWHNPNTGAGGNIPRAPSPAAISLRATCAGKRRPGCRERPAALVTASGR